MNTPRIIDVDADGVPLDGEPLRLATRMALRAGFMVNAPVVLRYPDGRLVNSREAHLTQKGLKQVSMEMGKAQTHH